MSEQTRRSLIRDRIEGAIAKAEADLPALTTILEAFKDLLVETAVLKAELVAGPAPSLPAVDQDAFVQGVPLAHREILGVSIDDLKVAAHRLGPAIRKGFPRTDPAVRTIASALHDGSLAEAIAVPELMQCDQDQQERLACAMRLDPAILRFVLGRLARPFVQGRALWMARSLEGLTWTRGYCPICGSWPCLSVIKEQEGQRWLTCSLCAHEWRFMRTQCPICENQDPERLEMYYAEGRESERAEACHACKRYIVEIDLRNRVQEPVMEVVPLTLVYLDILAQGQGFTPAAITDWNVIDETRQ